MLVVAAVYLRLWQLPCSTSAWRIEHGCARGRWVAASPVLVVPSVMDPQFHIALSFINAPRTSEFDTSSPSGTSFSGLTFVSLAHEYSGCCLPSFTALERPTPPRLSGLVLASGSPGSHSLCGSSTCRPLLLIHRSGGELFTDRHSFGFRCSVSIGKVQSQSTTLAG